MDEKIVQIEAWYDHISRNWVVQSFNADGYQIGDATYVGTREDATYELATRAAKHPGAQVIKPKSLNWHYVAAKASYATKNGGAA